ncbi:ATP-dependent RNA helicase SUPV3L1, mitochondrial [Zancudomyces culisetae]|uniref:ATP-dependent RNA helicase SUPV3L1, mitochondrial n=1 Tax=Zancudomyces culisetae TaxID=1213189 RepID=A0A1R1PZB6_ZANCU|nr:ATP-dependent RNA helicase SUPV3L1, mitochondrial [Zancudomyces culisetae]|eukprot:OMH86293.1 ATP-dependent RNA helicase SUPV3L1, mitochondrial [Zancudomyces culisetae]
MNGLGRPCMLLTGESKRNPVIDGVEVEECFDKDGEQIVPLVSSTIEMVNLSSYYQVAVIDEIQMLQDARRGQGWTSALLGLKAMEIHLCGEETAVPLVKRIFESCGEEVTVIKYERLSGLEVSDSSLNGTLEGIRDGDCIVAFSRKRIFELQRQIQSVTRRKCALIYGSLPPENRALQAQLFNDPNSEYKVLVASDAIGMGLNLKIQRVIFENVTKYDGIVTRHLSISQLKQIGGRAGRFSFASGDSVGQVTSLYSKDLSSVKKFMFATPEPIPKAGFFPSTDVSEAFFYEFPEKSTLELLDMIYDTTIVPDDYFIADISTMKKLAVLFSGIDLPLAQYLARNKPCPISDVFDIPRNPPKSKEHLAMYESLHKSVLLYLWLGYHFPTIYVDLEDAQKYKLEVEQLIQKGFLKR